MGLIFSNKTDENSNIQDFNHSGNNMYNKLSPKVLGPYSKAVKLGNILFCSGQIGIDPETMEIVIGGIEEETKRVIRNIKGVLKENKLSLKNVVKTTIYLKDINDFELVNNIYKDYFILKPARTTIEVSNLPKKAKIEIEVIAEIK